MIGVFMMKLMRHEQTWAGLRMLAALKQCRQVFTAYAFNGGNVSKQWDRVVQSQRQMPPEQWLDSCDAVIFTFVPPVSIVRQLQRRNVKYGIVVLDGQLVVSNIPVLQQASVLFSPSNNCTQYLSQLGAAEVVTTGWDSGLPLVAPKEWQSDTPVRVLFPLWDGNIRRTEFTVLEAIETLLQRDPRFHITVAYSSSTINYECKMGLRRLVNKYPETFKIQTAVSVDARELIYQDFDAAVLPFHYDQLCHTLLQSLQSGVFTVGFGVPPVNEYAKFRDLRLASCRCQYRRGELLFDPDYADLYECIAEIPNSLIDRSLEIDPLVVKRRQVFEDSVQFGIQMLQ